MSAFEELVTAEGETVSVFRNATSVDDPFLLEEHARRVGDAALDFVLDRFANLASARVVVAPDQTPAEVAANVRNLATLLAVLGFCLDTRVAETGAGGLAVTFVAPANYWGLRCLEKSPLSKRPLANDFGAKIVGAYLARCGAGARARAATTFDATSYTHTFALGARTPERSTARPPAYS